MIVVVALVFSSGSGDELMVGGGDEGEGGCGGEGGQCGRC